MCVLYSRQTGAKYSPSVRSTPLYTIHLPLTTEAQTACELRIRLALGKIKKFIGIPSSEIAI